ncbi:MAG: glycosyltransferase family 2 protein, partial [Anaerolineales bacterium]
FIWVLSKLFPKPIQKLENNLKASIIIPAFNEESVLEEKINNVLDFDFDQSRMEIIIVDDGSDDATLEIARSFEKDGIKVIAHEQRRGKVSGLNNAMKIAQGDVFIISDADITTEKTAIREIMDNFSDPSVGCVVGRGVMKEKDTETKESGGLYYQYDSKIKVSESNVFATVGVSGHSMAIRRELLAPIPIDIILDDFYLAMMVLKQGYRVIYEPKAVSWEHPTISLQDEIKRRKRITAGRYHIIAMAKEFFPSIPPLIRLEVVSHKFMRLLIPFFMILVFLSNFILAFYQSKNLISNIFYNLLFIGQILFYFLALFGWATNQMGKKVKILQLPYYLVATNYASMLGLYWFLTGQRTVLWYQAKRKS